MKSRKNFGAALSGALAVLAGTACTSYGQEPPAEVPHGYVEGAEETAEAQSRLVVADGDTGAVRVLDLITEEIVELGPGERVQAIDGDGRFAYVSGIGATTRIVDSGSWRVDHGDHVHYYRAEIREPGTVPGTETVGAYSDPTVAAISFADGTAMLLDRSRLDKGGIEKTVTARVVPGTAAVPYEEHVLATAPEHPTGDRIQVLSRDGNHATTIQEPCPQPRGEAVTRRGVVFGCSDGALLITEDGGAFRGEKIPYPAAVPEHERAQAFHHRPASATLAAEAGDRGAWSLDISKRAWTFVETGPVIAVNAVGEGGPLLTLTGDGFLHAYDASTGAETARTKVTAQPLDTAGHAPVIEIDTTRAYVNDIDSGTVHEIDYNDDLRIARSFRFDGKATHMTETGR